MKVRAAITQFWLVGSKGEEEEEENYVAVNVDFCIIIFMPICMVFKIYFQNLSNRNKVNRSK